MELLQEIKECFPKLEQLFAGEGLQNFYESDYGELWLFQLGLGTSVLNDLLQENSALYQYFFSIGVKHKEEMSDIIWSLFYIHCHSCSHIE